METSSQVDIDSKQSITVLISHVSDSGISVSDAKRYYTLSKKLLPSGDRAILSMMPVEAPESIEVFRFLLDVYPYQMQRKWDRAVFSGKGLAPTVFSDSAKIIEFVSTNKGAIGYVSVPNQEALSGLKEAVNVISVIK